MLQKSEGENDTERANRKDDDNSQVGWWVIVVAGLTLLGVVALAGFTLVEHKDRVSFLTVNALSVLIAEAVVMQVYIYRKQWKAMRDSLDETQALRKITEKSVEIAHQSMTIGAQAYVGIHSLEANIRGAKVVLKLENIGRAPTEWLRLKVEVTWKAWKLEKNNAQTYYMDFGHIELLPGNFPIPVEIPVAGLDAYFTEDER